VKRPLKIIEMKVMVTLILSYFLFLMILTIAEDGKIKVVRTDII